MRILVTNDDGIYSPGIAALAKAAARFGAVRVVAPDVERSSAGHAITALRPLTWKHTPLTGLDGIEAYRVNGTPADCVALGIYMWKDVNLVLSGINLGSNLGNGMWHSGTLAAAKQAVLFGVRGIALSVPSVTDEPDFDRLMPAIIQALEVLIPEDHLKLVNVNVPDREPIGLRWTRQSVRHYDGHIVPGHDPVGRPHFWFSVRPLEPADEDTDRWAIEHGYVSMTPLRLDLTDEAALAEARARVPIAVGTGPAEPASKRQV